MKLTKFWVCGFPAYVARDNGGADDGAEDQTDNGGEGGSVGDEHAGTIKDGDGKTFTQDEVNKFVVQRNRTLKSQYENLEKNYQEILKEKNLTEQQRSKIQSDLENVQTQLRTKEQQAAHEAKLAAAKHQEAVAAKEKEANYYKNLYETSTIEREITQAASKHDGFNPKQFIPLVSPRTKMIEELDGQGNKTGRLVPRVEENITGEDGNLTTVLKTVDEAIASMKEDAEFANFFKSNVARGIGSGTDNSAGGPIDPRNMTTEEYMANRERIHKQLGYKPRR